MKRVYIIIGIVMCSLVANAQKQLTILHTNDTHSTIYPLSPNLADTALANRGGFLRRINFLKEERRKDPDLLLFDSGDFCQGSPYFTLYKGDIEIELMNMMHYDAGTIGNHEFDFGLDNMARIFRKANFPIVCSNYDFTGTPVEGLTKDYVILKRKGVKIGVFALCPKMEGLVMKDNCQGVVYKDPVGEARRVVDILKRKKCDMIVCISHLGWDMPLNDTDDIRLVEGTRDIDIVLGGHSHTYFDDLRYANNLDGKTIPVDQNGKHAIFVGKMTVSLSRK